MNIYFHYFKQYFRKAKKIFIVGILLISVIYSFIYFLNKDKLALNLERNTNTTREQIYKTINDKELSSTKEGQMSLLVYRSLNCGLIGEACTNNPKDGDINYKKSLAGMIGGLFAFPYSSPPASGVYWLSSGLQNAGLIPNIYAAEGIGFAGIKTILPLWKIFRDFALLLIVIFLVIAGFMIMFRAKINPQTVITLESVLPRIVVSLLFIIFSFAIAGFLIDLMYVITILIVSQFSTLNIGDLFTIQNKTNLIGRYINPGFGEIFPQIDSGMTFYGIGNAFYNILPTSIQLTLKGTLSVLVGFSLVRFFDFLAEKFTDAPSNVAGQGGGSIAGFGAQIGGSIGNAPKILSIPISLAIFVTILPYIASFIISLLIFFSVFFVVVRIFVILLKTYIKILLLIIFSPMILLLGAFPGKNFIFSWIKNLSINLIVFPVVTTLVLLSGVIATVNLNSTSNLWTAPYLYGLDPQALTALIGVGIMLVIPDIIKLLKEATGVKDTGISPAFFGAAAATGGGAFGAFNKYMSTRYYMSYLPKGMQGIMGKIPGLKPNPEPPKKYRSNYSNDDSIA